ncbi:MAG: phage terminase large subunit family protein [Sulfurimonas sp.]|nr:phage terminase large subunit family protein [Sulfurimonas sp.]
MSVYTKMTMGLKDALSWIDEESTARWAENNIFLTLDVSPMTGMMNFKKTPWIEEILDDWDKVWVEGYNIMASTQTGKTTIEFICIFKELDTNPCIMQLTIPNDKAVPLFLKKKFNPFLRGIKSLQNKISLRKKQEKDRTSDALKEVAGGMVFINGNTENNRRSNTVKNIFIDEAALMNKGDKEELEGRTKSFEDKGRKMFCVSSRKHSGDEIEVAYVNSFCKKSLMFECQGCKKFFYPKREHFKYFTEKEYREKYNLDGLGNRNDYTREAIETAHVECPYCAYKTTTEIIKRLILEKKVKLIITEGSEEDIVYGYKLNALATGLTKYSTIAKLLIEAESDPQKLSTVYQDYFNEVYKIKANVTSSSEVLNLSNKYEEWVIPDDTIGLYMGVDSQKGYFWATIVAIEFNLVSNMVWCGRIEDEATIEAIMDREFFYSDGEVYYGGIRRAYHDWQGYKTPKKEYVTNADTGEVVSSMILDMPQRVKELVFRMSEKYGARSDGTERYYGVRGEQHLSNDRAFIPTKTGLIVEGYKEKREIKTLKVNTTLLKTAFMSSLARSISKSNAEEGTEAYEYEDRLHYINKTEVERLRSREKIINTDYDRQITSETFANHIVDGRVSKFMYWNGTRDNHFLDCLAYIHTAITQDSLYGVPKPTRQVHNENDFSVMDSLM